MNRTGPTPAAVEQFTYDERREILEIRFAGGGVSRFHQAPRYLYLGLCSARSPDKFYLRLIEPRYVKVPVYRLHWSSSPSPG